MSDYAEQQVAARREAERQAAINEVRADELLTAGRSKDAARRGALDTRVQTIRDTNASEKQAALTALQQQLMMRGEQAQRTLQSAPQAPTVTPNAAPLKAITGVSLTPEMAGANTAQNAFFISPEASQAQFAVGAPVGGGNIGRRQRGSTENIVSEPDNFNSSRKGKF